MDYGVYWEYGDFCYDNYDDSTTIMESCDIQENTSQSFKIYVKGKWL